MHVVFSPTYCTCFAKTLLSLRVSWGDRRSTRLPNCRGNTSHGTKLPVTPHDLVALPESPSPPESPRERYGPGDALAGAIQSFNLSPVIQNQSTGFSE
jgi:hypothetical protein